MVSKHIIFIKMLICCFQYPERCSVSFFIKMIISTIDYTILIFFKKLIYKFWDRGNFPIPCRNVSIQIRIFVKPEEVDDLAATRLARDISKQVEETMQYPGQIKVTVIRETRAVDYAK